MLILVSFSEYSSELKNLVSISIGVAGGEALHGGRISVVWVCIMMGNLQSFITESTVLPTSGTTFSSSQLSSAAQP